jgi:hypothetical protein
MTESPGLLQDEELHEVTAVYDNMLGLQYGKTYGLPVLCCSCGERGQGMTWAEAGEMFDEHLEALRW